MTREEHSQLLKRVDALERIVRRSRRMMVLAVLIALVCQAALAAGLSTASAQAQPRDDRFLTLRGLTVVDDHGVPRVRLGAPLPDPTVLGKQVPRQGVVSGVMLYDSDGDERGGYVTEAHGDVFLKLDAKQYQQSVFIANRDGGANLSVWSGPNKNNNYVSVQAVPTPLIEIVQNGTKRVFTAAGR